MFVIPQILSALFTDFSFLVSDAFTPGFATLLTSMYSQLTHLFFIESLLTAADDLVYTKPTKPYTPPTYDAVVGLANRIELPDDFYSKMTYLQRERARDIENALRIGASTDEEFIESKMFWRMKKAYEILEPKSELQVWMEEFETRHLKGIKPQDEYEVNYTNKINVKGEEYDISEWDKGEILTFLFPLDANDANQLYYTERVQSLFHVSTPTVKLYYPEPYIAAPSRIHNDLWILHIMYNQFWLWFFFIFIVVFFFLTFITAVRWDQNQNRPRRETRGVSRSKCGDLITACVPVSWAGSIIISESTDAIDNQDGFSTGELVVGVRAYQWGWEYYYPKTVDLNYNVKPSYSHFIGNSVKYTTTSTGSRDSNHFWRHYQKRALDSSVTPAYLMVLPCDNTNVAQFMNFKDAGINTLKQSGSFAKIRANSKLFTTNVVTNADQFSLKYAKICEYAFNENNFNESVNYGNTRQHNLTSIQATKNVLSTFLNETEMRDYLTNKLDARNSKVVESSGLKTLTGVDYDSKFKKQFNALGLSLNQVLNTNSLVDKKKTSYPVTNLISKNNNTNFKLTNSNILALNSSLPTTNLVSVLSNKFLNNAGTDVQTLLKSDNTNILAADQLVRNYANLSAHSSHPNLSTSNNSAVAHLSNANSLSAVQNTFNAVNGNTKLLFDTNFFTKLWSRRASFGHPHPITYSNNALIDVFDYDTNMKTTHNLNLSKNKIQVDTSSKSTSTNLITYGDQSNAVPGLAKAYWRMFWSNTDYQAQVDSIFKNIDYENNFYLPTFTNYYDYDFRNAQALELLEDAFWEVAGSSYTFYDYINFSREYVKPQTTLRDETLFNQNYFEDNDNISAATKLLLTPSYKDVSVLGQFYTNSIESDDFFSQSNLTLLKDFFIYSSNDMFSGVEDLSTTYKTLQTGFKSSLNTPISLNTFANLPTSYLSVFNNFRADFEDFSFVKTDQESNYFTNSSVSDTNVVRNLQLSNLLMLRNSVKNSIVTFNALRKVFRARFDEGRSHTSLQTFAQSALPQPFINDRSINYSQFLSKDSNSFYQSALYKNTNYKVWNTSFINHLTQNFYFYDLPFLLSEGSDSQKFMWFDWWAQWGMYEVQPSSVAKYSTLGVPYSRKHFDFGAGQTETLNEVETYFTRLARLRKNYLSNWLYSPFLFNRLTVSSPLELNTGSDAKALVSILKDMHWYHQTMFYKDQSVFKFTPSISGFNLYNKSSWRPFTGIQDYFYKNAQLLDILTKREFLYRKYLQTQKRVIHLPKSLTANVGNTLIDEIKSAYLLADPITYSSESSRDFFYWSLPFFKFLVFKTLISDLAQTTKNLPFNVSLVNEYLFFFAFNNQTSKLGLNETLYKDQHRPLKKSITNMLRLHGTGAVAMPVDTRLQILASSRDVIHSWAIPSAGIKIDCVPGYTSHRIMTFTLTGIYWGQCMEICGRYHHWMPIIVYFMKRDLFFLWCTHFVFKTSKLPQLKITDKQYTDYLRLISYDKTTWLNELSRQK